MSLSVVHAARSPVERAPGRFAAACKVALLAFAWVLVALGVNLAASGHALAASKPVVTSLSPNQGPASGNNVVIVTGSGFTGATAATLGDVNAVSFAVDSDTQIRMVMPAWSPGVTGSIQITGPGGTSDPSAASTYTYLNLPAPTGFSPTSGPVAGGTTVVIPGQYFTGTTSVTFGGAAASFTVNGDSQITAVTPPGLAGASETIVITTPAGQANLGGFLYIAPPTITGIPQNAGTAGATIDIQGTNLVNVTSVMFGNVPATFRDLGTISPTDLQVTVPTLTQGQVVDVRVTTAGGTTPITAADKYTYGSPPIVTAMTPSLGVLTGGTSVVLQGSAFTGSTSVMFGSKPASFTINSDSQITAISPPGSAVGTVPVTITNPLGTSYQGSFFVQFNYVQSLPTLSPASLPPAILGVAYNQALTVTGGAGPYNFVFVSGTLPPGFTAVNTSPTTAAIQGTTTTAGSYTFTILVGDANGATASQTYTIVAEAEDIEVLPASLPDAVKNSSYSQTITATGGVAPYHFAVTAGALPAGLSLSSNGAITGTPSAAGPLVVTITATDSSSTGPFTGSRSYGAAGAPPSVTSISPTSGSSSGGTSVVITGAGFTGATSVKFGVNAAKSFTVNSDSKITAVSPAGGQVVDVTVTSANGTSQVGSFDRFTYTGAPIVTGLNVNTGVTAGGTSVVITGYGFTAATAVHFGGVAASGQVISDNEILVDSPAHVAGTVDIIVVATTGNSAATAADKFTYVAPPVVKTVSPNSGPATGGTKITVTGSGFTGAIGVSFNGAQGPFTVVNDTTLSITTPANGAGTVDIVVTTPYGASAIVAGDKFTFQAGPPDVTQVNSNYGEPGTGISISGDNLKGATAVHFGAYAGTILTTSDRSMQVTVPSGPPVGMTVDVTVTTNLGTSAITPADQFTYNGKPTVVASSPLSGPTSGGTTVVITGSGFSQNSLVYFGSPGGTAWPNAVVNSINQITVTSAPAGPGGAAYLFVRTFGGDSDPSNGATFAYVATPPVSPAITGVSPSSGPPVGGTSVTLTGSGFTGATQVRFDEKNAVGFTVFSDTQIKVTSPPGSSGPVDITVVTPNGVSALTSADRFTYTGTPVPLVTGVSPNVGSTAGGVSVVVTGTGFTGATSVRFGAYAASPFTVNSDSQLTVTSPSNVAGPADVTVISAAGASAPTPADVYNYLAPDSPTITSLTPATGAVWGGNAVIINGTNLTGANYIRFGDTVAQFNVNSPTQITAIAPQAAGPGVVDVTIVAGSFTTIVTPADKYTYVYVPPTVTGVSPPTGPPGGGTGVTITGTGLNNVTSVKFGTAPAAFTLKSDTQLTATAPAGTGSVDVIVANVAGPSAANVNDHYLYAVAGTPVIGGISPSSGLPTGGTSVVISGVGFSGATAVKFGAKAATSFTVNSDSQVTAVAPSGSGTVDIAITTPTATSGATAADQFSYVSAPTVTSLSPNTGPTSGGTSVTITGTNFSSVTGVTFGGVAAPSFTVNGATSITAVSPQGVGVVDVIVNTSSGASAAQAGDHFTYTGPPPPAVTSLTPNTGPTAGNTPVTLTGTNFTGATAVKFGTTAVGFTVVSATSITTTSPPNGPGPVDVTVTTPSGVSTTNAGDVFTYPSPPVINAISPTTGSAGTVVTVTGQHFTGATAMRFGGTNAPTFTVNSDTKITVTAPPSQGGVYDITVVTPNGASPNTAADQFTYPNVVPVVTAIAPSSGSKAGGTSVVITGTGFTFVGEVIFGSTIVNNFTINSDTQITAISPAGTGTVDIKVAVTNATSATSSADLFTFTNAPAVNGLNPSGGPAAGATSITISGSGFTGATAVKFGTAAAASFSVVSDTQMTAVSPAGSGVVDVLVTTPNGTSAAGPADKFTYALPPPTVTSVSPTSGPVSGNTSVTIKGTGFTAVTAVKFDTNPAVSFTINSDTQITAVSPGGNAGTIDITVTSPTGVSATGAADHFTYAVGQPIVSSVSPATGPIAGSGGITILGSGFTGATAVKFGATSTTNFSLLGDNQILVAAPAEAAGTVDVVVVTPVGSSAVSAADHYTYVAPAAPAVTAVSPASGTTLGQFTVTITGTGFTNASAVKFGATPSASFAVVSDLQILATAPAGAAGLVDITVTTPVGTSATGAADHFTYVTGPVPVVTGLSPNTGPTAGGASTVITGTGFTTAAAVKFGATAAPNWTVNSDTQITVLATPPGALGAVDVTVTTSSGVSAVSAADQYTYVANTSPPVIQLISDSSGPTTGGTVVQITGLSFSGATAVKFGATAASTFTVNSDTGLTVTAPPGSAGVVDITVTTPAGVSAAVNADKFTYVGSAAPSVTAIAPAAGPVAGGTSVVLTGGGFTGVTAVRFGATAATGFTVNSDTQITATSPAGAAGGVNVIVTATGGASAATAANLFTYEPAPAVTAISPNSGPVAGGASVVITGTGFAGATAVKFGTIPSTSFNIGGDGQITAVSPPGTLGAVDVTVVSGGGASAASAADKYTYVASGAPAISSVAPPSGSTAGGTVVTITGSGLTGATAVKFGTKAATAFTVNSDTQITATSPSGAGTVDITVTTGAGTSVAGAGDKFTYAATPAVNRVSPTTGPATGGTSVTITGTAFTGATAVSFGATPAASFTVVSAASITATSPPGSGTVDVLVTGPGGVSAARAVDHFAYSGATPAPAVTAINPASGPPSGGTSVTLTGTNFTGATSVKFGSVAATFTVVSASQITATSPAGAAGGVNVTVTTASGTSATGAANLFTYLSAPAVSQIAPNGGPTAGGTSVVITGTGFTGATAVKFGAASASFTLNSATQITATSPVGAAGAVDVTVTTAVGTSATGSADLFTYTASASPPTITGLSPTTGPTTGGTSVVITGTSFTGVSDVMFGGVHVTTFTVNSDSQITAIAPVGTPGVVDVSAGNINGTSIPSAATKYTYVAAGAAPTVTALSPSSGPSSGGTSVVITGTGFTGALSVQFSSTPAQSFVVNSDTQITATSPIFSAATIDVTVTTPNGTSVANAGDKFTFGAGAAPVVTGISPTAGPVAGGTSVIITGSGFSNLVSVSFGAVGATSVTAQSDTQVVAVSPAGAAGVVDVTVKTIGGTSAAVAADHFTYTASTFVSGVAPGGGPITGGTSVVIAGGGFTGATAVKFGTKAATAFTVNSDGQITATSPSGTGTVDITVTAPAGVSAAVAADKFAYVGAPTVSRVAPTSGPAAGGTSVAITGTNFSGVTSVMFGATPASTFVVNSATSVTATSPPGSGLVDVIVTAFGGTSIARSTDHYTYTGSAPAPTVTGVSPTSGPTAGGTSVTLTGTNFTGATAVKFGTVTASFTVNSASSITATSPAAAAGAVDVTVTTASGTSAAGAADKFTYTAAASPPTVTAISPTSGSTSGGTAVTISGANFTGATAVKFGTASASFTLNSATSISATAPAGSAGTLDVTVTTTAGTSATGAADQFTYTASPPLPAVTAISPSGGNVSGGTGVVITGVNFTGATSVKFGTVSASFSIDGPTGLSATSPPGSAGIVDITVTTGAGTSVAVTADRFTYSTAAKPTLSAISPNSGPAAGGTTVILTGTGFTGVSSVDFGGVAPATSFTVNSDTQITAISPAGAGITAITVTGPGGLSNGVQWSWTGNASAPVVSAISPASGVTTGGTSVVVTGSGFTAATAVKFGTKAATSFTVNSDTQVTAVSPSGTGTVDVTVTTSGGTSASVAADKFTYAAGAAIPVVSRVNPATGPAAGGTSVTITGTNFTGATAVMFGTAAASFSVTSGTTIAATSPAGSGTVDVLVTTPAGTSTAKATDHFIYKAGALVRATIRARAASASTASVDLTGGGAAGDARILSMTPASAGVARIVEGALPGTFSLSFTPRVGFTGQVRVSYALAAGPQMQAATGVVELTVDARPDPSADPSVRGLVDAETDAALRFADAQIANFGQRLESLHDGKGGAFHNGVSFGFGFGETQPNPWVQRRDDLDLLEGDWAPPNPVRDMRGGDVAFRPAGAPSLLAPIDAPISTRAQASASGQGGLRAGGSGGGDGFSSNLSVWTGGAITFGERDAVTGRAGFHFTSDGLSAGVDGRLSDWLTVGVGGGFGAGTTKLDGDVARVESRDVTGVVYASIHPQSGAFVDAMAGYGRLDFSSKRLAGVGLIARGDRSGTEPFVSLTAGWDLKFDGFKLSPYGRVDAVNGKLEAFTESGAGMLDLKFDEQSFNSLRGTLGVRGEWAIPEKYGVWTPHFRAEAHHEFRGADVSNFDWADGGMAPGFSTTPTLMQQDSFTLGLGVDLKRATSAFSLDYDLNADSGREVVHALHAKVDWKFW